MKKVACARYWKKCKSLGFQQNSDAQSLWCTTGDDNGCIEVCCKKPPRRCARFKCRSPLVSLRSAAGKECETDEACSKMCCTQVRTAYACRVSVSRSRTAREYGGMEVIDVLHVDRYCVSAAQPPTKCEDFWHKCSSDRKGWERNPNSAGKVCKDAVDCLSGCCARPCSTFSCPTPLQRMPGADSQLCTTDQICRNACCRKVYCDRLLCLFLFSPPPSSSLYILLPSWCGVLCCVVILMRRGLCHCIARERRFPWSSAARIGPRARPTDGKRTPRLRTRTSRVPIPRRAAARVVSVRAQPSAVPPR